MTLNFDHRQGISTGCNQFYTFGYSLLCPGLYGVSISGNMGFPQDKSTDTISGLGSIVIPENLASNVSALHQFLYGVNDYSPSSKVNSISEKIVARVGAGGNAQDSGDSLKKMIHHLQEGRRIGSIMNRSISS